jgi:hypothetical protein
MFVFTIALVKESQYFASSLFASGLLVGHDTVGGRQEYVAELTRGQEVDNPLFQLVELDVKAGTNDTALVETAIELNDNFVGPVVVDDFEFSNVACNRVVCRV